MTDRNEHWEQVYSTKSADAVSWHQQSPRLSLELIRRTGLKPPYSVADVGGGAAALVDHLLADGCHVTVVDIAAAALTVSQRRLAEVADQVSWVVADVVRWRPANAFDLWHDRAVFHFLTDEADRCGYVEALSQGVRPGGWAVIATFAIDGPERCSGLPVRRYDPLMLAQTLGAGFALVDVAEEDHRTPAGGVQKFVYCLFSRVS